MWATITKPFAWLLLNYYEWTGNYGVAVILFALTVNLILMPFMAKSKKSMMRSTRLQPRLQELQRKHEGNPQKLNEETAKLYREEHINPMSGCLWSLIPFPILIALYSVIRQPITRMIGLAAEQVTVLQDYLVSMGWYTVPERANAYFEIDVLQTAHAHWDEVMASSIAPQLEGLQNIDYGFLGLNLGTTPQWNFFMNVDWGQTAEWLPALGLFLIPLISAFMSWLSMKVSSMANPPAGQAANSMKSMNIMMPVMSIWICFVMPAALGVYWIANSLFGMARDFALTKHYKKKLDREDAERMTERAIREREIEEKRRETERLKAEGRTAPNSNTSKKKIQAKEKQTDEERRAAAERAEREARRARRGIKGEEIPASQVGHRRYARGRAYDPDRFGYQEEPLQDELDNVIPELEDDENSVPGAQVYEQEAEAAEEVFEETAEEELSEDEVTEDEAEEPDEDDNEEDDEE